MEDNGDITLTRDTAATRALISIDSYACEPIFTEDDAAESDTCSIEGWMECSNASDVR
jgi:hypothetical protein